jgi:DNA-binding transcriptional regulator YdaS (Cro superfamily)
MKPSNVMKREIRTSDPRQLACRVAVVAAGGPKKLAKKIGISSQAISKWRVVPSERVLEVERYSGISRHTLRPDTFGPPAGPVEAAP